MAGPGGALERAVMEVLWDAPEPYRVRKLLERLNREAAKPWAYNTVQTVADRLARKGLLERRQAGMAFLYSPVQTRDEYIAGLMIEALTEAPERGAILARFAEGVDAVDARDLLEALRKRATRDEPGREDEGG